MRNRIIAFALAALSVPTSATCAWIAGTIHNNDPLQLWFAMASIGSIPGAIIIISIAASEGIL